jgi:S-adenosylmethionine hydrolase
VVQIDHFGNLITNISGKDLDFSPGEKLEVWAGGRCIGNILPTYSRVKPGKALATIGGFGWVEIAVNRGRAAEVLDLKIGSPVRIRKLEN